MLIHIEKRVDGVTLESRPYDVTPDGIRGLLQGLQPSITTVRGGTWVVHAPERTLQLLGATHVDSVWGFEVGRWWVPAEVTT